MDNRGTTRYGARVGWLMAACWLAGMAYGASAEELPAITPPVCAPAPVIDGVLDDAAWKDAAEFGAFRPLGDAARADAPRATRVRAARDAAWLYLAFECTNAQMARLEQKIHERDGTVQTDDSVEIYLDVGTGGEMYYHWMLNWAGVKADRRVIPRRGGADKAWDMPWRAATRRHAHGWTAETALPLCLVVGPGDPAKARLNIMRNRILPGQDRMGATFSETRECSSWAPVRKGHDPDRFGYLKGLAAAAAVPFLPAIAGATVGRYALDGETHSFPVAVDLLTMTLASGTVHVVAVDAPAIGERVETLQAVALAGMATQTVVITAPAATLAPRAVTVELRDAASGEVWQRVPVRDTSCLTLMTAPVVERNYYTDEPEARIQCALGFPDELLERMTLVAWDAASNELARVRGGGRAPVLKVPITGWPPGRHPVRVAALDAQGRAVVGGDAEVVKQAPNPGAEVKIDRFRRVVLHNGKPFFPFGMIGHRWTSKSDIHLRRLADAGFTAVQRSARLSPNRYGKPEPSAAASVADTPAFYDKAAEYGLAVMDFTIDVGSQAGLPGDDPEASRWLFEAQRSQLETMARARRNRPNLLANYSVDEPNLVDMNSRIAVAEWYYTALQEWDPYHPVFLLFSGGIPPGDNWVRWGEILAQDVYIAPGWGAFRSEPNYLAVSTVRVKRRADAVNKVTWMMPVTEAIDSGRWPIALSPAEQRAATYLALIHGTKGLFYFARTALFSQPMWETLSALAGEVKALAPALLEGDRLPVRVEYRPGVYDIAAEQCPDVQARVFQHPDSQSWILLAANSRWYPVNTTFALDGLSDGQTVKRLFGGSPSEWTIRDGTFSETLERFGTRAYEIGRASAGRGAPTDELRLTVTMKPDPESGQPVKDLPKEIRQVRQRRNIMPNPSFERHAVHHIPDYVMPWEFGAEVMVGHPDAVWGVDTNRAFLGQASLRMRYAPMEYAGTFCVFYPPKLDQPTPYVFSAYLRGRQEGAKATVMLPKAGDQWEIHGFTLTTNWARYSLAVQLPPAAEGSEFIYGGGRLLSVRPSGLAGSEIWVDAMQMERGTEPTAFTEQ